MTNPIDYAELARVRVLLDEAVENEDRILDEMKMRRDEFSEYRIQASTELARVQAMLDEARVELREWSCSCRANRCDERGRLQPVVEARDECPRLRARTFLAKGSDLDSLRGTAPDATGETSSEAFVRKMRDEWPG